MKPFRQYHLLRFLNQFDQKTPLDLAFHLYFKENRALGSKDRKFIAEQGYGIIRWLGLIDYCISKPVTWEKRVDFFQNFSAENYHQSQDIPAHIRASCPKFLFQKLQESLGDKPALEYALNYNQRAPLTIRANCSLINPEDFYHRYHDEFQLIKCSYSPVGFKLKEHLPLFQTSAFKEGLFEVQDEASQLAALLVEAQPKEKVLDYCSGSGGKSLAIAPQLKRSGCLYLHDIRPQILLQAKKRFKRAKIDNYQLIYPTSKQKAALKGNMDWVLVDAPCTGSVTYRRNPDLKWKFNEEMLTDVIAKQRQIVDEAIAFLKPKGKLVYTTCSVLKDENEKQTEYFAQKHNLKVENKPLNSQKLCANMDGFYGVTLTRE